MGKITVITSGKGGVGKTTVTANLGVALSLLGRRVALVDMDMGLRNLDAVLGLENRIAYDLADVSLGNCPLSRAMIHDPRHPGLALLPASRSMGQDGLRLRQMREIAAQLAMNYDDVILDCPAGVEAGFRNAATGADGAVVVAVPEVTSIRDAARTAVLLREMKLPARLLVNRMRPNLSRRGEAPNALEMVELICLPLFGVVQEDRTIVIRNNAGLPAADGRGKAAREYRQLAREWVIMEEQSKNQSRERA